MSILGGSIEIELKRLNMSQHDLARSSGLTPAAVSQIVCGKRQCTTPTLIKICRALETTPNDLLGYHSQEPYKQRKRIAELEGRLLKIRQLTVRDQD